MQTVRIWVMGICDWCGIRKFIVATTNSFHVVLNTYFNAFLRSPCNSISKYSSIKCPVCLKFNNETSVCLYIRIFGSPWQRCCILQLTYLTTAYYISCCHGFGFCSLSSVAEIQKGVIIFLFSSTKVGRHQKFRPFRQFPIPEKSSV
jgi:hypothetical protein